MRNTLAGLTEDHEQLVLCALHVTNNHDLAAIFAMLVDVLDGVFSLVLKEMFSTRSEIIYWEKLSKSSGWEIFLAQWNSKIYRGLTFQQGIPDTILENSEDMTSHIECLRADFHELAVWLSELHDASINLKIIFNIIQSSSPFAHEKFRMKSKVSIPLDHKWFSEFNVNIDYTLKDIVTMHLEAAIKSLVSSVHNHLPEKLKGDFRNLSESRNLSVKEMHHCCCSLISLVHRIIDDKSDQLFPLEFSGDIIRRPSNVERFWVRNLIIALATIYGCKSLMRMIRNGSLGELFDRFKDVVQSKIAEHVIEPLTKLKQELFETIRSSDDHIVAKRDLELSKAALERMLTDFSKSKEGYALILPNIQVAKEEILRNKERIFSKDGVADVVNAITSPTKSEVPQVHTIDTIRTGDALVDLSPTPEQALIALMNEYEKDLQHPIRGILFGNLFTAILIQVQKLKVHTEAAMLKMDQILASNELTIAATAAMPAFGVVGLILYNLKGLFTPKAQSGGQDAVHFQLILADVERSMQEVNECERSESRRVIAIKKEPVAIFPFSPSRRRVAEQEWLNNGKISNEYFNTMWNGLDQYELGSAEPVKMLEHVSESDSTEANLVEHTDHKPSPDRVTSIAKGLYIFNLVRLRSKFYELFEVLSPLGSSKIHTVSMYEIQWKHHKSDTSHSLLAKASKVVQSCFDFFHAIHTLLFGSNELMSLTTQYHSLNKDISLLESPVLEFSWAQKMETAKRMRLSYRILSPLHH